MQCGACSKYGLLIPEEATVNHLQQPVIQIADTFPNVTTKLRQYLQKRERLESVFTPPPPVTEELRYNQPWIRDTSLQYYALIFDHRERHIVEWKGQWRIKGLSSLQTELRLDILEVIFMGPPKMAGPGPNLDNQWFETERDPLRAMIELRRFWMEAYPDRVLPPALTKITTPALNGKPQGADVFSPHWKTLRRSRPF